MQLERIGDDEVQQEPRLEGIEESGADQAPAQQVLLGPGEAVGGEDAVEAQDRDAHVEQSLAGSVERDVHPVTIGELPDRCAEILGFIAHQHPPGAGVASRTRLT